ncbi:DEAD-box ATP-dependent RNA helicase 38 isoform X2 [Magnolia sinica]|uniref:DEAD-box ATP-dependent RNA helicase 38 isoform X2 n=1 Tax=Magnolia sinica TaxID=86752 RepID=UPI00265B1DF8|nr:DEAD-box ATP-dependent RNA helicase 38 isoform X2 [Magnolia sinica]
MAEANNGTGAAIEKPEVKRAWGDDEELDATETPSASSAHATSGAAIEKPEVKRAWGDDEELDATETPSASSAPATSSDANEESEPNIASLSIKEGTERKDTNLDDPEDSQIETVTSGDTLYSSAMTFEELNLSRELLRGLYVEMRFKTPSKIQAVSLPMILTPPYKNLIAQAHNGSGKTTCFVLGMLSRVDPKLRAPQALCICPTRELAIQNQEVLSKMGKHTGITSICAIPLDSSSYIPIAKRPPVTEQVIIGTPGTIKKWMAAKKLSTRDMKILVFDEADHMLAEVLLFSATFNETVKEFVSKVVKDGNQLFVKKEELSLDTVKQYKVSCPDELAKIDVIKNKIFELGEKWGQTIIFVRTRRSADTLYKELEDFGYDCTCIHGAHQQDMRDKMIKEFKEGLTKVLISTDLLSRGFDQAQVNLVVNYDLPVKHESPTEPDYEVYLHRVGRAGRFGRNGAVFNLLCTERDFTIMEKIERHFNHKVEQVNDWKSEADFERALKDAGLL